MNKKDFNKYIENNLNGLPLEKQIKILRKIQENYLPTLIHSKQRKLGVWIPQEEKENYMFCEKCKKYILKKKCKREYIKEIRTEMTYIDAGYGDDDKMGDVEYGVIYVTCPVCGNKQEEKKYYIKKVKEWNRREGRK